MANDADAAGRAETEARRARLAEIIRRKSFRCGELFRLSTGIDSNVYFNMKPTMMDAAGAGLLGHLMHDRLRAARADYAGGLELGAVPLTASTITHSASTDFPVNGFFVRKKTKDYGAKLRLEGLAPGETLAGRRVAVIEDVCTTGAAAFAAVEDVRAAGGEVVLVLAVIDRQEGAAALMKREGLAFEALFRADEFIPSGFNRLPPVSP